MSIQYRLKYNAGNTFELKFSINNKSSKITLISELESEYPNLSTELIGMSINTMLEDINESVQKQIQNNTQSHPITSRIDDFSIKLIIPLINNSNDDNLSTIKSTLTKIIPSIISIIDTHYQNTKLKLNNLNKKYMFLSQI